MVSMALDVLPIGEAGVNISAALVVGEKVDTLAYPARTCHVALYLCQALKLTISANVAPELPDSSASIPFPMRRLTHIAPNNYLSCRPVAHRIRHAIGQ